MAERYSATRTYGGVSAADRASARRARLVAAAADLFGRQGYLEVGVKDLCRAAGVTDRYFYESFHHRAELFAAAFDLAVGELFAAVAGAVTEADAEPEAQARAAVGAFVRTLAADPGRARLLFVEAISVGSEVEQHVRASIRRFAELLAATARPHVGTDLPDRLVTMGALSLVGAMQVIVLEWLDGNLEATAEEITDYFVDMLLVARIAGTAG